MYNTRRDRCLDYSKQNLKMKSFPNKVFVGKRTGQMSKVISWCFYVEPKCMERLPEYIAGLKCNQRAAKRWFPGWKLRLYISKAKAETETRLWEFIDEIAKFHDPPIEVFECDPDVHPTLERYSPFCDPTVDVCIARDVDSILSKTDADIVNDWVCDDRYDVLQYREYMMTAIDIMGGGVGLKRSGFVRKSGVQGPVGIHIVDKAYTRRSPTLPGGIGELKGKGFDERSLSKFLMAYTDMSRWKTYVTRMSSVGDYYLLPEKWSVTTEPSDLVLLWTTPFFDAKDGYAYRQPGFEWLEKSDIRAITDYVRNMFCIRPEHTGSHWPHHSAKISAGKTWVR